MFDGQRMSHVTVNKQNKPPNPKYQKQHTKQNTKNQTRTQNTPFPIPLLIDLTPL